MISYDLDRTRKAVAYLVDTSYAPHHIRRLRATVERPKALPFKGDAEPLNELLVIGRQSRQAMENLIEVARAKRDTRNDYQRDFMAAKRRRERRAIELEEMLLERRMGNTERAFFLRKQAEIWGKEREQFLASLDAADWKGKNERLKEFWARKEQELERLIEEAKNQPVIHRKAPKRVVVVPKPEPATALGQKLTQALRTGNSSTR